MPNKVDRLAAFFPTPGYCDEEMVFFRLGELTEPTYTAEPDEDEDLEPRWFAIDEARRMVETGEIVDMKTVVGLTLV